MNTIAEIIENMRGKLYEFSANELTQAAREIENENAITAALLREIAEEKSAAEIADTNRKAKFTRLRAKYGNDWSKWPVGQDGLYLE